MTNQWRYQQYDHENKTIKNYYINNYHPLKKNDHGLLYFYLFILAVMIHFFYRLTLFLWEQLILLKQKIDPVFQANPIPFYILIGILTLLSLYCLYRLIKR